MYSNPPRPSTFAAISSWAAHVQPGSPGSPRRQSISSSFLVLNTPSPDHKEFTIDLTDHGYNSVFVMKPTTPVNNDFLPSTRAPLRRLRSFNILRNRKRSNTVTLPPSPNKPRSPVKPESPQILAASIATRKKAVYAHLKPSKTKPKPKPHFPPSLAAELALMQFADGGSTQDNIKRLMEAHARAAAPAGTNPTVTAVGDVYRDGKGGIWWDREEEMEYVHLLGGHDASRVAGPEKWVSFGGEVKNGRLDDSEPELALASLADAGLGRRDSANSIASNTSSLDPCNVVKPAEDDAALVRLPLPKMTNTSEKPTKPRTIPEPILTIPSRPRHRQHHLRPSPNFFLLDLNAFAVPATPRTPHTPRTPRTPSAPYSTTHRTRTRSSPVRPVFIHHHAQRRARGPARRRPAPLNIVAHVPMRGVSPDLDEDALAERAKHDFLEASFKPPVVNVTVHSNVETEAWPVMMHREAVYRVPQGSLAVPEGGEKTLKKKGSRRLLNLFGRK
ncbi:hypothetical protein C0991_003545 [Blastosporella zonata]|nr:hypothetical protein C0991_003545 [Blastosporella zonata]